MMNDETVHNAVKTVNESQKRLLFWDSTKSANKSDAHNLKREKLYDLLALAKYYRYLWLNCKQSLSACSLHEENSQETCRMSTHLHDELYHYADALRHWNWEKHNNSKNFLESFIFINFIFFLYYEVTEYL